MISSFSVNEYLYPVENLQVSVENSQVSVENSQFTLWKTSNYLWKTHKVVENFRAYVEYLWKTSKYLWKTHSLPCGKLQNIVLISIRLPVENYFSTGRVRPYYNYKEQFVLITTTSNSSFLSNLTVSFVLLISHSCYNIISERYYSNSIPPIGFAISFILCYYIVSVQFLSVTVLSLRYHHTPGQGL